jgi:glycosyltransferase involved in cell wall biosynthesis
VDLLVADTLEEMLNSINNLENNSSLRENLIRNARSFVKQHYSWESGISELKKSLIT